MKPLLAIDGDSLAHRAFHALPSSIRDAAGRPANMVTGFANMVISLYEAERPRSVFVGFDTVTHPTYRHELLPVYQSGRSFPPELTDQLDRLPLFVEALGFRFAKQPGYEADDFLAAAVRAEEARGGTTLVVTSDRDMFQLASEMTTILAPRRGVSQLDRVGPSEVRERYGVEPAQVPDFIALRGDSSDRIPGASGIGPARAAGVLREYETLEAALEAGRFEAEAADLRLYRQLATLQADAPIPELPDASADWQGAAALVSDWGLGQLAGRLKERAT